MEINIDHIEQKPKEPFYCLKCSSKPCEKTDELTFDICNYGVAFFNRNGIIEKKEPNVNVANIATNLRHEINPVLQTIIEHASKVNPNLSTKKIDTNNPLSVIIGSTVILDNFIQMITGIHEFHTAQKTIASKKINLRDTINTYFDIYSILKEEARPKKIKLNNMVSEDYSVSLCSDFIKYIIVVLIDNVWKYSANDSTFSANIKIIKENKASLVFKNRSSTIPANLNIFDLGVKAKDTSKGFGFGLYWAKVLEFQYNSVVHEGSHDVFRLIHNQYPATYRGYSHQEFILDNFYIEK